MKHIIVKTIQVLSIFFLIIASSHAEAIEHLEKLQVESAWDWSALKDLANQGIAAGDNQFYTSSGYDPQNFLVITKFSSTWQEQDPHIITYENKLRHIGDIAVYGDYVYAPLSDFSLIEMDENDYLHIAWFDKNNLSKQGHLDLSDWAHSNDYNIYRGDLAGVTVHNDKLYIVEYQKSESEWQNNPRIFALPLINGEPKNTNVSSYEISTRYANGIEFKGDYIYVTSNYSKEKGLINVYWFGDLSEFGVAHPFKQYTYNIDDNPFIAHAEGLTFNGDDLWVAQGREVHKLESPIMPDGYEPNDTWDDAFNFGMITDQIEALGLTSGPDSDWFRFATAQIGTSYDYVRIAFSHSQGDLDMELYKQINPALITKVAESKSSSDYERISLDGLPGGTYYLRVYAKREATDYILHIFPPGNTRQPGNHLLVDADHIVWGEYDHDNGNGHPEQGEEAQIIVPLKAVANVQNVTAYLSTSSLAVNITDNESYYGAIPNNGTIAPDDDFNLEVIQGDVNVSFDLRTEYEKDGFLYVQFASFQHVFPVEAVLDDYDIVDTRFTFETGYEGDWDGVFESGEEINLQFKLKNDGGYTAYNVRVAIVPIGSDDLQISHNIEDWEPFGDIAPGQSAWPISTDDNWEVWARENYAGTVKADIKVIYDGIDDPIILSDALEISVGAQPWLAVDPGQKDFGVAGINESIIIETNIINYGTAPMLIGGINIVKPENIDVYLDPDLTNLTIEPGLTQSLIITIEPNGFEGQIDPPIEIILDTDALFESDEQKDRIKITGLISNIAPIFSIPSNFSGADNADVDGERIVWQDSRNGNPDIYLYDIVLSSEYQISDHPTIQSTPKISGNLIAWNDYRNQESNPDNCDIYAYDIENDIHFIVSNDQKYERLIGVDNNKIAFARVYHSFIDNNGYEKKVYDIIIYEYLGEGNGQEWNLTQYSPGSYYDDKMSVKYNYTDFSNGTLAWEEEVLHRKSTYWTWNSNGLKKYQLSSGNCPTDTSPITITTANPRRVSSDNCKIVWEQSTPNENQVFMWENGSSPIQITPIPSNISSENTYPVVGSNHIVYWKKIYQSGTSPQFLVSYNIDTGQETVITTEQPVNLKYRIDGNTLVFKNIESNKIQYTYLIDGKPPVINIESPVGDVVVPNDVSEFLFQGTANDEDGTVVKVEYKRAGGLWQIADGTTIWNFTATDLNAGSNSYEIRVLDNDNNIVFGNTITIVRNVLPELVITSPTDDIIVPVSVDEITITGTTNDIDGLVDIVEYRINDGLWFTVPENTDWTVTISDLHYGVNIVEIRAKDKFGDYSPTVTQSVTRESYPGDINADGDVTLSDAILALQIIRGMDVTGENINIEAEVNGDNKIGLAEVVYILQNVSGLR